MQQRVYLYQFQTQAKLLYSDRNQKSDRPGRGFQDADLVLSPDVGGGNKGMLTL